MAGIELSEPGLSLPMVCCTARWGWQMQKQLRAGLKVRLVLEGHEPHSDSLQGMEEQLQTS